MKGHIWDSDAALLYSVTRNEPVRPISRETLKMKYAEICKRANCQLDCKFAHNDSYVKYYINDYNYQ